MKRRAMVMVGALAFAGGACGGDDGAGSGEWCDVARDVEAEMEMSDVDFTDPESFEDAFQQIIDRLEDAAGSAPDEIEDDLEVTIDGFKELFEALQDVDFDFEELDESALENPEVDDASERIEAYTERECGTETDETDVTDETEDADVTDVTDDADETDETDEADPAIDETDETDDADPADETDGTADSGSDSDTGDDGTISGEGTIRDAMVAQFAAMGLNEDQANCLVDNLDLDELVASGAADPSVFFDLFETCEIDPADLQPGG